MRKFKLLFLVLILTLSLYACGDTDNSSSSLSSDPDESSSTESSSSLPSSSSSSQPSSSSNSDSGSEDDKIDFTNFIETASSLNSEISFFEVEENIASTNLALNALNTLQIVQLLDATGFVSDEVVVVVTPSAEDAAQVSLALEAHIAKLIEDFTEYNPAEVPKLENAIYYTEGAISALFVGDYAEQYRDEFLLFLKEVSL